MSLLIIFKAYFLEYQIILSTNWFLYIIFVLLGPEPRTLYIVSTFINGLHLIT